MLERGDPNVMLQLGVIKVLGVKAASQQTLFIVSAPHPSNTRRVDQNAMMGLYISWGLIQWEQRDLGLYVGVKGWGY